VHFSIQRVCLILNPELYLVCVLIISNLSYSCLKGFLQLFAVTTVFWYESVQDNKVVSFCVNSSVLHGVVHVYDVFVEVIVIVGFSLWILDVS